ncbi:hypothetical protein CGZ88_0141 [Bifidobacterium anseris]|uniref:Uncharacterized protein n=2 Tax=Bifidobacterium anseris TaxID=2020963 RepID=A0A2N5J189_9BIFI|nr:hypothetical protein CGZ88_0141 [Bifidobacterium anseris]
MSTSSPVSPHAGARRCIPKMFLACMALVAVALVCAIVSLRDDSEFYSDIFVEISVFVVFIAGFFTNSRRLQLWYLIGANVYVIIFLSIFGKVFYDNFNRGVGVLVLIQLIFSAINLVPICVYHLSDRTFFYSYQRQLIYPTMFFAFVLLGHLPGGDLLTKEVTHEIFSLIIFAQAFDLLDSIHRIGKAHHMAAYSFAQEDGSVVNNDDNADKDTNGNDDDDANDDEERNPVEE